MPFLLTIQALYIQPYQFGKTLFLLLVLSISIKADAQSIESRILEIKEMYKIATKWENYDKKEICKKGSKQTQEENELFMQNAKLCSFPEGYKILYANFKGWEWSDDIKYYYQNGKLFFIFYSAYSECGLTEYRVYFNKTGNVIRILKQYKDCSDEPQNKNIEIKRKEEYNMLVNLTKDKLKESYSIIQKNN